MTVKLSSEKSNRQVECLTNTVEFSYNDAFSSVPAEFLSFMCIQSLAISSLRLSRGGEPIYYNWTHKLWIVTGGPQITFEFILKLYL